jgi:hypothetical protein
MSLKNINLHLSDFSEKDREIIERIILSRLNENDVNFDELACNIEILTFTSKTKGN